MGKAGDTLFIYHCPYCRALGGRIKASSLRKELLTCPGCGAIVISTSFVKKGTVFVRSRPCNKCQNREFIVDCLLYGDNEDWSDYHVNASCRKCGSAGWTVGPHDTIPEWHDWVHNVANDKNTAR